MLTALFFAALNLATISSAGAADGTATTPTAGEMTPTEWRRLQLEAADKSDHIMRDAQKQAGLLAQYEYMQLLYDASHERAFQLIFGQYLSWFQTFVGDYNAARRTFSIAQPAQADDAPSPLAGNYFARAASDVVLHLTKNRKAVFFNEAHSAPITRTLTIELLTKLREQGFTYFAAETLYSSDHELQQRGYPVAQSGFYVSEPLYGEMVRTALKLGFHVIAYDVESAGTGDARERAGAETLIAQVFKKDPNARLVVNAGFAHIQKAGKYLGGSSMAEFFQKLSGINPLCIEQTMLIQHARPDQDSPIYHAVTQASEFTQTTAFVADDGKPWTLKPGAYDLSVFFPPQKSAEGRPSWLGLGGLRVSYPVSGELCRHVFPCLVEAHYAGEDDNAVAADRVLLNIVDESAPVQQRTIVGHATTQDHLFLRPAKYRLIATDQGNRVLSSSDILIAGAKEGAQ